MNSNKKKKIGSQSKKSVCFSARRYVKRFFVWMLVLIMLFCSLLTSVSAAPQTTETGFIEYQTEASIDFKETIEVILTNKESGYYYTHYLYSDNDYMANKSVPLGTYSISAKVISKTTEDISGYSVLYTNEDIEVKNTRSAVAIPLRVEILTGVEVSEDDYTVGEQIETETSETQNNDVANESLDEFADESIENKSTENKKDHSLLYSTLVFLGLIAVVTLVYLLLRRKFNK